MTTTKARGQNKGSSIIPAQGGTNNHNPKTSQTNHITTFKGITQTTKPTQIDQQNNLIGFGVHTRTSKTKRVIRTKLRVISALTVWTIAKFLIPLNEGLFYLS
jgi:hypothetical protein